MSVAADFQLLAGHPPAPGCSFRIHPCGTAASASALLFSAVLGASLRLRGFLCSVVVFLLPQLWLLVFRSRPAPGRPPAGKALCAGRLPQPRSGLTGAGP